MSSSFNTPSSHCHYHYHYEMGKPMANVSQEYEMGDGWIKLVCLEPSNTKCNPTDNWVLKDYDYHEDWLKSNETSSTPFKEPLVQPTSLFETPPPTDPPKQTDNPTELEPIEIKIEKPEPIDLEDPKLAEADRLLEDCYYNEEKEEDNQGYQPDPEGDTEYVNIEKPGPEQVYYYSELVEFFKEGYWYLGRVECNYGDSLEYFNLSGFGCYST